MSWQVKCTSLPTQSHLLQFLNCFYTAPSAHSKSHRLSCWFRVITWERKRSEINEASDNSVIGTCVFVPVALVMWRCSLWGPWDFITQREMKRSEAHLNFIGWGSRLDGRDAFSYSYSVLACLKLCVGMQSGDLVRGNEHQVNWHISLLLENAKCDK